VFRSGAMGQLKARFVFPNAPLATGAVLTLLVLLTLPTLLILLDLLTLLTLLNPPILLRKTNITPSLTYKQTQICIGWLRVVAPGLARDDDEGVDTGD
jgi:hypothetical protein